MPFKALGLSPHLLRGVQAMGYSDPTPIQLRAIPVVLSGQDLIGSAQTGTGKTAAFALPILEKLRSHRAGGARVLILEPTRELAAQVETSFRDLGRFSDLRALVVHGGVGYGHQRSELRAGVDVIVATPGRLLDFAEEGLRFDGLEILVLDEVDRMLDMGFLPDVRKIIRACPDQRQTLFFSATVPPEIAEVAAFALRNPARVEIGVNRSVVETVTHAMYPVAAQQKFELLLALLERTEFNSVLVFSRTKHGADRIARRLKAANHAVAVLHANRSQNQRVEALAGFKSGKYEVMVATDIAARGIDVAGVSHVINYDVPGTPEDYVHRIGRTGRALAVGDAFTLVTPEDIDDVHAIERFIGQGVEQIRLENFNYMPFVARPPQPHQQGRGGKGRFAHDAPGRRKSHGGHGQGGGRGRPQGGGPRAGASQRRGGGQPGAHGFGGKPAPAPKPATPAPAKGFFSRLMRGR